jgi:serine/threonine-protein kinase
VREQSVVTLTVSAGPPPVAVPDLTGLDRSSATDRLAAAGLRLGQVNQQYSETVPADGVLDWAAKGGQLAKGTAVDVLVSAGPQPRTVPDVSGQTFDAAAAALRALGLVPVQGGAFSDTVPVGIAVSTTPAAGGLADRGSRVSVNISKGPDLVAVPDVTGKSVNDATALLAAASINVSNVFGPPTKTVFFTDPTPGTKVKHGSSVNLYTR